MVSLSNHERSSSGLTLSEDKIISVGSACKNQSLYSRKMIVIH